MSATCVAKSVGDSSVKANFMILFPKESFGCEKEGAMTVARAIVQNNIS